MMVSVYHRQSIPRTEIAQKRVGVGGPLRAPVKYRWLVAVAALLTLTRCDPVQVIEGSDTHVSVRYDGVMNGLDQATELAKTVLRGARQDRKIAQNLLRGSRRRRALRFFRLRLNSAPITCRNTDAPSSIDSVATETILRSQPNPSPAVAPDGRIRIIGE